MENLPLQVSDAIALINQTLEYAYPTIVVEGEVASFKVNQNRYVFFDIKDETGTLNCFMTVYQLRIPLEDGMKVRVVAAPKITQWGRFSLTVRSVQPVGEGSLKRSFDLLKAKLDKEGLFAPERKRPLPTLPRHIAVISSTQAAGYGDFIKILNDRWGGLEVSVAHTLVQGFEAPGQIVRAIEYFNQLAELPEVIVILRGGGSADDLSSFNDEPLVRAIAASRVPVLTGIGHEVDISLADLVADQRAATPSNAAQLLVPDKREMITQLDQMNQRMSQTVHQRIKQLREQVDGSRADLKRHLRTLFERTERRFEHMAAILSHLNPKQALQRGYAIVRHGTAVVRTAVGLKADDAISIEVNDAIINAGVTHVEFKK